jgi:UDPglucose 6-dehydrogenase
LQKNERCEIDVKVGVIGLGTTGKALIEVISLFHQVKAYDIDPARSKDSLDEVLSADALFLALPTTLKDDGRLDTKSITEYLEKLDKKNHKGLVIIKSTLPVNYLKRARKHGLRLLYSPEFLHEKTAKEDMLNQPYVVVSGSTQDFEEYRNILSWIPPEKFHLVDDRTAELIKLTMNAFAATKISFVNEIERISKIHGADEEKVMAILRLDKRCGEEYAYPNRGPYGGKCLPKDVSELKNSANGSVLFDAVEEVNEKTKKQRKF